MIGLDTNIVVRYLTQDDPVQSRRATQIIEQHLDADEPGFISVVTIAEIVWVLDRIYDLAGQEIATVVERLLQADTLLVQNEQQVFTAVESLKARKGSFADALIGALGQWAGCSATLTFDRKASKLSGFEFA